MRFGARRPEFFVFRLPLRFKELGVQCNEIVSVVKYSLVTVTELTATRVMMTTRGLTLPRVCDFTCLLWIEISRLFLYG